MTRQDSTTDRVVAMLFAALLATSLVAAAAAPAAADHEEDEDGWASYFDGAVEDAPVSIADRIGEITGMVVRTYEKNFGENPETNATENIQNIADAFNERTKTEPTWGDYLEGRVHATDDRLVYEVTCDDREGRTASMYLVADRDGDRFVNERFVSEEEFQSMNRTVDHYLHADWYTCENAPDEIADFYENFVKNDKNVTRTEQLRLGSQYESGIETDIWGDDDVPE